jgi:disulfide bond formation protein DsbB
MAPMRLSPRIVFAAIFVICVALTATAIFYMQEYLGLDPCPMCILQRYAFFAIALVALVAAIHGPERTPLKVYTALVIFFALAGGGVAVWHSYLQHFPPERETCGSDLDFLLSNFPLSQALPKIFAGGGSCSKVSWKMLGLSIPEWALVWFVIFALVSAWVGFFRKPR